MLRKAFTASAVTVVTAAVLAVPATAFADAPSPSPADTSSTQQADGRQQTDNQQQTDKAQVSAQLSSSGDPAGFRAGESVTITATTSGKATGGVTVSSSAFGTTHLAATDGSGTTWAGTATISKNAGIGTLPVKIVADYGDTGAQTTVGILVNTVTAPTPDPTPTPTPDPQQASMTLSTDGGKPGDRVQVTIDKGDLKGSAHIESGAFGGSVNLTPEPGTSSWHGTATISANTKPGYYRVDGYVGTQKIDSAKFGVADTVTSHQQKRQHPHPHLNVHHHVAPVNTDARKIPKGAVEAGASGTTSASAASSSHTGLIAGAAGLSVAVLLGGSVLWRRHNRS
ncbi:hypothetical protein [Streptomyces sp. NPDC048442]|uniref:hypothetical protein n=1 Tax=Streptomyces sp. NPDC048442 TaxID=3154823 RepID=UPI0034286EFD